MLYIKHMIRTQVYLTQGLHQDINLLAQKEKRPAAELIRELLQQGLNQKYHHKSTKEALLDFAAGAEKGGPADLSENIDKYLYENE